MFFSPNNPDALLPSMPPNHTSESQGRIRYLKGLRPVRRLPPPQQKKQPKAESSGVRPGPRAFGARIRARLAAQRSVAPNISPADRF